MANGKGGFRIGAGRKKKETVVGIPKHNTVADADNGTAELVGEDMPQPNEYLSRPTHGLNAQKRGVQIYERTWSWLKVRDCEKLINPENL
jgi:hypothetical protein